MARIEYIIDRLDVRAVYSVAPFRHCCGVAELSGMYVYRKSRPGSFSRSFSEQECMLITLTALKNNPSDASKFCTYVLTDKSNGAIYKKLASVGVSPMHEEMNGKSGNVVHTFILTQSDISNILEKHKSVIEYIEKELSAPVEPEPVMPRNEEKLVEGIDAPNFLYVPYR